MNGTQARERKQYEDPSKVGPMVTFYLGYQNGMDRTKRYSIPVTINGYRYTAVFGERNTLPKAVVEVLKNSKSAIHPTPRVSQIDGIRGGEGRSSSELLQSQQREQYVPDYEIVTEKEG